MTQFDYDLFTIGAGSGGVRASRVAASFGARVGVAESGSLGGTCVNLGCIPKKLLSYAAAFAEEAVASEGYGWSRGIWTFDWHALIANKNKEIARLNLVYEDLLTQAGVQIHKGRAIIVEPHTIEVDGTKFTAEQILVATGSRPAKAQMQGHDLAMVSDDAFDLPELPPRVLIVGAGYIAVEFASIFNGLGSRTTVVHRGSSLLREFDSDVGEFLRREMTAHGVAFMMNSHIVALNRSATGILCTFDDGSALEVDKVLFATGRLPNTDNLGLQESGVATRPSGAVIVDPEYRTNIPSIYAIGDCIGHYQLTPVALAEGAAVAHYLFNKGARRLNYANIPTAVFSHPNVASVGLSEAEARTEGYSVKIFSSTFTPLKHTLVVAPSKVMLKLVVDALSDRVLGAHMVGPDAGETIQGIAIAVTCGATKQQFDSTIGIHPTIAEEFVTMRQPVKAVGARAA
jgi:glutathione reductase (NADPH)